MELKDYKGNTVVDGAKIRFKILCVYGREFAYVPYTIGTVEGDQVSYMDGYNKRYFALDAVLNGRADYLGCNPTHGEIITESNASGEATTSSLKKPVPKPNTKTHI